MLQKSISLNDTDEPEPSTTVINGREQCLSSSLAAVLLNEEVATYSNCFSLFLMYCLKALYLSEQSILQVIGAEDIVISSLHLWIEFANQNHQFPAKYASFRYFRGKG